MKSIAHLLHQPESKTLEFKRDLSSPRPILKTLLAFANTSGGRLVIGVTDSHKILGLDNPLDEEERLCSLIADGISPKLVPNIEDMKLGISRTRNHIIARVFRELNFIEQWGSGVRRIFNEAKAQGLPEPEIIEIGMRVRFTLHLAQPITTQNIEEHSTAEFERLESRLESKLAAKVLLQINKKVSGKAQLAEHLGHKSVSGELHKQIKRLLELNLIEMTLPEKPNSRLQKYRLTHEGQSLINPYQLPSRN